MKNKKRFLFSIVLLLVNVAGAAGGLLDSLGVVLGKTLLAAPFLWGMLLLCLLSAAFWTTRNRMRQAVQWLALLLLCLVGIVPFRRRLAEGLGLVLAGLFEQLNVRNGIQLIWNFPREGENILWQATWSVLVFMVFYVLLIAYAVVRERALALVLADSVWFAAACAMDKFPAYLWLILCILGLAAVLIRRSFRDDEGAAVQAVLLGAAVLGAVMAPLYRFGVPFLDSRYESLLEARIELNKKINEEWIPGLQQMFAGLGFGFGGGTDVSGSLTRETGAMYTADEIYRVTFSAAPESTVYLRGFVGKDYGGSEWKAAGDADLENYYREKGLQLPENREELLNLTYEVFRGEDSCRVTVEELAAPGSYAVYPCGARIPEDYESHWDGTVERKQGSYEFLYSAPEGHLPEQALSGTLAKTEAGYRAYVYDTFCEYPAEQFPELTAFLEQAEFRTDSVYHSLEDVLTYLRKTAVYDLGVANTPAGEDFVEYFLFASKRGYCAHFASSAVLLLRYLGVPARYAVGYAAAPEAFQRNADGTYSAVIRDRQAHAWAEVYLDGIGWVPVEMTPGAAPFPQDNRWEQLELVGQLSGVQDEDSLQDGPDSFPVERPEGSGKPEDSQTGSAEGSGRPEDSQTGSAEGTGRPEDSPAGSAEGTGRPEDSQTGSAEGTGSQEDSQAGSAEGTGKPEDSQAGSAEGSGKPEDSSAGSAEGTGSSETPLQGTPAGIPLGVLLTAGVLLLFCLTGKMIRRASLNKLRRAENREKVFLLYQNTKRLMKAVGCAESLNDKEEAGRDFNRLLEKCSFGEQEPDEEELRKVWNFCQGLERKVYGELPFYKKLLFLGLDRFGLRQWKPTGRKQSR